MFGSEVRFERATAVSAALVVFTLLACSPCFAEAPESTDALPSPAPAGRVLLTIEAPYPNSNGEYALFGARAGERPRRLCSSCALHVEAGDYQFGLRVGRRRYRDVGGPIHLARDTQLVFSVQSRRNVRIFLGVVGALATVVGIPLILDGARCSYEYSGCEARGRREPGIGITLAAAGPVMLLAVPFVIDRGRVHVTTMRTAPRE